VQRPGNGGSPVSASKMEGLRKAVQDVTSED